MTTKLVDDYVNFIMDSMSQQILENYGDEWFEYVKENN